METIHVYSRAQAIADGVLVDVSEQAQNGMLRGFRHPVALTAALWAAIEAIPASLQGIADRDGRLYDVLGMAVFACSASRPVFQVILPFAGTRKRTQTLRVDVGPGDAGEPVVTIGFPEDF